MTVYVKNLIINSGEDFSQDLDLLSADGVVYLNKDAIIENVKSKVMESVLPSGIGGALGGAGGLGLPSPSTPTPEAPASPIPLGF